MDAMIYTRCTPEDIALWNVTGWTWDRVLDAYIAMEDFSCSGNDGAPYFHGPDASGASGPDKAGSGQLPAAPMRRLQQLVGVRELNDIFRIQTAAPGYVDEVSKKFVESAQNYGLPRTLDFNDPNGGRRGVGYYFFNIRNGIRDSAAVRMLSPLLYKNGLRLGINSARIDVDINYINGESNKVYGEGVGRLKLLSNAEVTKVLLSENLKSARSGQIFASDESSKTEDTDRFEAAGAEKEPVSVSSNMRASGGCGGGSRGCDSWNVLIITLCGCVIFYYYMQEAKAETMLHVTKTLKYYLLQL